MKLERWIESGRVPDAVLRVGIRRLLRRRLADEARIPESERSARIAGFSEGPIAVQVGAANAQHYEVDEAFYGCVLGRQRKYSACWFEAGVTDLDRAEEAMLSKTAERARVRDGERVLELGCGWGALSLWLAVKFPRARITALSNSHSQRRYIEAECARRRLTNLEVVTADINEFAPRGRFERIVSVEMFEHLRNHRELFRRIHGWLEPGGTLFVHVFAHKRFTYTFETEREDDWLGRHFFTGGLMPADDLLPQCAGELSTLEHWRESGVHYQKTAEAWLANLDRRRGEVLEIFARVYGRERARAWFEKWRVFFMACAELWGFDRGREWIVSHYLFANSPANGGQR